MSAAAVPPDPRLLRFGQADVQIYGSDAGLFAAAEEEFFRVLREAVKARARCSIALTGGSTPRRLYESIAQHAAAVDWSKVTFFFGDERCVPPDHPDSNFGMASQTMLSVPPVSYAPVHRIKGELPPPEAAREYEQELRDYFGDALPRFDLVLLGMGPDGHCASLFPGSAALAEETRWVAENWVQRLDIWRITFTFPLLNSAAEVLFLLNGEEKRAPVQQIFKERQPLPAARVQPAGKLLWMMDEIAGGEL